jgi:hypothetical protein
MNDLLVLLAHLLTTIAKLLGPGGTRAVVADSLLMKQQLLVINRSRRRVVGPEYSCSLRKKDMMKAVNGWEFHNVARFRCS